MKSIQGHYYLMFSTKSRYIQGSTKEYFWCELSCVAISLFNFVCYISDAVVFEKLSDSMDQIRSDFAMETEAGGGGMVGIQLARGPPAGSTNPLNSLKNLGTELR